MKSRKIKQQVSYVVICIVWGIVFWGMLSGCGKDPEVGPIEVIPKEVTTGGTAQAMVQIKNPPSNLTTLLFKWTATRGRLYPDTPDSTPSRKYIAPETPGPDTITLQVFEGEKSLVMQSVTITVKGQEYVSHQPPSTIVQEAEGGKTAPPVTSKPFFEVSHKCFPSGWMGDGEKEESIYVRVDSASRENPHSPPTCYKWIYDPGPKGWAAVAWQYPENNFGEKPGWNLTGYSKVTFWVRGQKGGEQLTFKAGGQTNPQLPYQASFEETATDMITLTRDWQQYEIDLTGKDLSNVPCAFVWVAREMENPDGCTFYLDDIQYER